MARLAPCKHRALNHILTNSRFTRIEIAKRAGVSRQTIYDWEYQLTAFRYWMLEMCSKAAEVSIESIPAYKLQLDAEEDLRRLKGESKPLPRIPKNPAGESMHAESTRQKATPPAPAKPAAHVYTDKDCPDVAKIMLDKAQPYEILLVPAHWIPNVKDPTTRDNRCAKWWFKGLDGVLYCDMSQAEAIVKVEKRRKADAETLARDLI